jgi:hypothetical protein
MIVDGGWSTVGATALAYQTSVIRIIAQLGRGRERRSAGDNLLKPMAGGLSE